MVQVWADSVYRGPRHALLTLIGGRLLTQAKLSLSRAATLLRCLTYQVDVADAPTAAVQLGSAPRGRPRRSQHNRARDGW